MTDTRTSYPARKGQPLDLSRMVGLETAATMLGGQVRLAGALGIEPRSLRAKLTATRGISDADLIAAAVTLEAQAARLAAHAGKLRLEAAK